MLRLVDVRKATLTTLETAEVLYKDEWKEFYYLEILSKRMFDPFSNSIDPSVNLFQTSYPAELSLSLL
jgi:hypothetical protein